MYKKNCGFTLVELLVVVAIVAIIATFSIVYFFESLGNSRDGARKASFNLIATNLELFYSEKSRYPMPDDVVDITYSGGIAWSQGVFGESVVKIIRNFGQEIPFDPLYENYYSYSITNNGKEYQIGGILEALKEKDNIGNLGFIPKAHASIETAYVEGNYNEIMLRVKDGSGEYTYIASPSIISTDTISTDVIDIITDQKIVYNEFFNLPASYSNFLDTNGGFNFNVTDPIVFSGSTQELKTQDGMTQFIQNLQYIYSVTPTESFDRYISFIQDDGTSKMKKFLTKNFQVSFSYPFSCQDLYDQGDAIDDRIYAIDVDGGGPGDPQNVYCDVRNDGTAWTQIGNNHLGENGGDFFGANNITTNYYSLYPSSSDNSIIPLSNPGLSPYVVHQTGGSISNYEVHFDDFSQVKLGDEIIMRLWVADNDGVWTNSLELNPESGYMFHNRIYYSDGTFSSNGNVEVIETKNISGKTWNRLEVRNSVRKDPQDFAWYIGLDSEDVKNLYFTGVELELFRH